MYHGTHESFHGNLIMGGQCTFTIHQWQFSIHDRQQDKHTVPQPVPHPSVWIGC